MAVSGPKPRANSPIHDAGIAGPKGSVASLVVGHDSPRAENDDDVKVRARATSVIRRASRATPSDPTPLRAVEPVEPTAPPTPIEQAHEIAERALRAPPAAEPAALGEPDPAPPAAEPAALGEPEPAPPAPEPVPLSLTSAGRARSIPPAPPSSGGELRALVDPTQRPSNASPSVAESMAPPASPGKPLLASEALMEDLAPVQPARRDARIWCLACGVGFILFGTLPLIGLLPGAQGAALPWLVTGIISLLAGVFDVTYRQRAVSMLVLGLLTGLVALQGSGTLVRADGGAGWGVARLFSVVTLTAALLFRARYRAYAGARVFLATALVISVPFAIHAALVFWSGAGFGPAHIGAILVLVMMAATLIGFMGSETTGAGPYVASVLVFTVALELASRGVAVVGLDGGLSPLLGVLVGAAGFGAAAGFTALGLFQILAWRFADDARRIDIHSNLRDQAPKSEHDPVSEWSTRE